MDRGQYIEGKLSQLESRLNNSSQELIRALLLNFNPPTDDNGHLKFSLAYIALFNRIWDRWVRGDRKAALDVVSSDLSDIHQSVLEYYSDELDGDDIEVSPKVARIIDSLGFSSFASGTFAGIILLAADVKNRIQQKIIYAMTSGQSFGYLGSIISEIPTELSKYHKGYLFDLYSQVERIAAQTYAIDLNLTHAVYAGDVIETTREFCEDRVHKAFSLQEIQSWNDLDWRGKIPGVDVLVALGGYNCRHYLNWVSEGMYNQLKEDND